MPRHPRVHAEGLLYHVMARDNDGQKIFLGQSDYQVFIDGASDGAAESRPVARDVVDVLDSKGESPKRSVRCAGRLNVGMAAERSGPIVGNDLVHELSNADKENNFNPARLITR